MNVDEALAEIFADRDSDLSDESDQESEDVWELSGNSSESDNGEENESVEEDDPIDASDSESEEDNVRANNERQRRGRGYPRGPARGGLGAARAGPVRARGGRGAVRASRGTARGARGARGARVDPAQQAALEAQWVSVDREPNVPAFTGNSGIKAPLPNNPSTGDILSLFLTDEFFDILVEQTNLYAAQYKRNNPNLPPHSRAHEWFDTTRPEMKQFIALSLLMGIVVKPGISDYWSTSPLLKGSIFNSVMSRNRFQSILQFLHFADNSQFDPNDPDRDRLYKVRPVVDYLVNKFKTVYIPEDHISIDEELLLWKGNLSFKQYIPMKRARFGIKMFSLCENSGYLWNSFVYLGKEPNRNGDDPQLVRRLGKSGAVIPRLMETLLNKGYRLYVDNWYTSQELFTYLHENSTAACGTARKNRIKLPRAFTEAPLAKGEHSFRRNGDLLAVRFNDKKEIYFLSTIHKANMVNTGRRDRQGNQIRKLQVIHDYNRYMGGVDRNDEMIANYNSVRKSMKWTKKVAFHFIEEAVLNSFLLKKKSDITKRFLKFKLEAISSLLAAAGTDVAAPAATDRLSGRHFPELIPPTPMKQKPQKRCVVCTRNKRRKESIYQCGDCPEKPGLCAAPCFRLFHTQPDLNSP